MNEAATRGCVCAISASGSVRRRATPAWLSCMGGALKEVVADESLRAELYAAFAKLADWMRNDPGNPHDRRHERQVLR